MKTTKKRTGFTAMLLIVLFMLTPAYNNTGDKQTLTPEFLASTKWGPESWVGMTIEFEPDGHYKFTLDHGGYYIDASGTYNIKKGKLDIKIENSEMGKENIGLILNDGTLCFDPASPKYRQYISFKDPDIKKLYLKADELKIWNHNSLVQEGELLKIGGHDTVTMGVKNALTTTVVKFREAPDISAKEMNYSYDDTGELFIVKALPKDKSVIILARTKEKNKVGKWNNYWYYVEFETNFDHMRAWVYGEFVKIL